MTRRLPGAFLIMVGMAALGFIVALALVQATRATIGTVTPLAYHEECDPSWDDCGSDDYSHDYSSRDRNRNRGRNRGAFSPGPFDDSPVDAFNGNTICLPGSTCYDDRRDEPSRGRRS